MLNANGDCRQATPKGGYRVRFDHVDPHGKISLRRAGRMHHLGVGIRLARQPVLTVNNPDPDTVIGRDTGEVLSTTTSSPTTPLAQPTTKPGPMARAHVVTEDATQV